MKSILISIRPEWVAKILNGEKTIEIRKTAPKCDLPIDVYIYCTKGAPYLAYESVIDEYSIYKTIGEIGEHGRRASSNTTLIALQDDGPMTNGKVVAKFRLEKVKNYLYFSAALLPDTEFRHSDLTPLLKQACMTKEQFVAYTSGHFYAWHISDLEIFDEPRELDEFDYPNPSGIRNVGQRSIKGLPSKKHPPQSWCYVEVEK